MNMYLWGGNNCLFHSGKGGHVTEGLPCWRWSGNYTKNCRDNTQLGIVSISKIKNKDATKMDVIAHFHMRLDFNINDRRDFKCFKFQLILPPHISITDEFWGVNTEPVIFTVNL
jgi:hypothetical protein